MIANFGVNKTPEWFHIEAQEVGLHFPIFTMTAAQQDCQICATNLGLNTISFQYMLLL